MPQLVTEWCETKGVACRGIGPVVFYKVRKASRVLNGRGEGVYSISCMAVVV